MEPNLSNLLYDYTPEFEPGKGSLIVSEPMMREEYFSRSVVLLLDADKSVGHLGLVMNKPSRFRVGDLFDAVPALDSFPVFAGGPVGPDRFFMIHELGEFLEGSGEIVPGLYIGGRLKDLAEYVASGGEVRGKVRFFLGYSGWTRGQLKGELENRSWSVIEKPDLKYVLRGSGNMYWRREVERMGEDYRGWLLVPEDVSNN